jgi:tRNA dimethylallyltransferase
MALSEGPETLHAALQAVDPGAAAKIQPADMRRLIRALEVYEATGRPISAWQRESTTASPYDLVFTCLTRDRDQLYRRIEDRTERMLLDGFVAEVDQLLTAGYPRELPAMQGLGYRELSAYLAGESTLDKAVAEIKKRTRHYAKRQLTWFRREPDVHWFDLSRQASAEVFTEILGLLEGRR